MSPLRFPQVQGRGAFHFAAPVSRDSLLKRGLPAIGIRKTSVIL